MRMGRKDSVLPPKLPHGCGLSLSYDTGYDPVAFTTRSGSGQKRNVLRLAPTAVSLLCKHETPFEVSIIALLLYYAFRRNARVF